MSWTREPFLCLSGCCDRSFGTSLLLLADIMVWVCLGLGRLSGYLLGFTPKLRFQPCLFVPCLLWLYEYDADLMTYSSCFVSCCRPTSLGKFGLAGNLMVTQGDVLSSNTAAWLHFFLSGELFETIAGCCLHCQWMLWIGKGNDSNGYLRSQVILGQKFLILTLAPVNCIVYIVYLVSTCLEAKKWPCSCVEACMA